MASTFVLGLFLGGKASPSSFPANRRRYELVPGCTEHSDELKGYWATLGGFDENGTLIAWCALLSDGKYHGILLDVLVHPRWQKQGVGRALVAQAVAYLQAHGIRTIHVDFLPERAAFYERCGFRIGLGGIYEP